MLQRIDIFNAKTKEKVFGLSMAGNLSDEEVVLLDEELSNYIEEKKVRRTKKKLINDKPVYFIYISIS